MGWMAIPFQFLLVYFAIDRESDDEPAVTQQPHVLAQVWVHVAVIAKHFPKALASALAVATAVFS